MNQPDEFFLLSPIVTKDKPSLIAGLFVLLTFVTWNLVYTSRLQIDVYLYNIK